MSSSHDRPVGNAESVRPTKVFAMHRLWPLFSSALQLIYVAGLITAIVSVFLVFKDGDLFQRGDPKMLAGELAGILMELGLATFIGIVGVALARSVLRSTRPAPHWFIHVTPLFAWSWIIFIPIGTLIGALMFRWRRTAVENLQLSKKDRE